MSNGTKTVAHHHFSALALSLSTFLVSEFILYIIIIIIHHLIKDLIFTLHNHERQSARPLDGSQTKQHICHKHLNTLYHKSTNLVGHYFENNLQKHHVIPWLMEFHSRGQH